MVHPMVSRALHAHLFYVLFISALASACGPDKPPTGPDTGDEPPPPPDPPPATKDKLCEGGTISANIVAITTPYAFNRLGANQPDGMIFALARDVQKGPQQWELKPGVRPRPLVLRVNEGQCLKITFTNHLAAKNSFVQTDSAGAHVMGMSLVRAADQSGNALPPIDADASFVGANSNSLAERGETFTYTYHAEQEGAYLMYSTAADVSDSRPIAAGQLALGLFGAVHVEPRGSVYYRSQVTREELARAVKDPSTLEPGSPTLPVVNYDATHDGVPVLKMVDDNNEIVHGDLTAIIAYADPATGAPGPWPDNNNDPLFAKIPASPDRTQPFREITTIYHAAAFAQQAYPCVYSPPTGKLANPQSACKGKLGKYADGLDPYVYEALTNGGSDAFGINYGFAGIGSEILSNRLWGGGAPADECASCKYEEFFLSSWPLGDPAQVVTVPADAAANGASTANNKVLYPDDPSNVYHSYLRDHVKFRVLHGGSSRHHVHHQHAHQWLHSPNSDTSHYLDSQAIGPGSAYTLEMVYNGSGNRNETPGDSIFHCHFYPHFAAGMWSLWRVHDVLETGTKLDKNGLPVAPTWNGKVLTSPGARALPDKGISAGTPIPAVVPLPTRPMAPKPGAVTLSADGTQIVAYTEQGGAFTPVTKFDPNYLNPGYPFYIPGKAGQRAVRPPLDVPYVREVTRADGSKTVEAVPVGTPGGQYLNGGLPRALITGIAGTPDKAINEAHTRLDFHKETLLLNAQELAEQGEPLEVTAMNFHERPAVKSCTPEGNCNNVNFELNGLKPQMGAPYADPCGPADDWNGYTRRYRAADIQLDVVFNKEGWHYPQQRMSVLWDDVFPTLSGNRPPEPLFFRANSRDCIEFWLTNLVPKEYTLDDWQVRTPTDVLGQHIHLVKFDVTSSDGAANGYNYEDGALSPGEVTERINALNDARAQGLGGFTGLDGKIVQQDLVAKTIPGLGLGTALFNSDGTWAPTGAWKGAMVNIQRWMADPLDDNAGKDRTLRTVFTHDHFSPSTHQQIGLYAGLLVEPEHSEWDRVEDGLAMGGWAKDLSHVKCASGQKPSNIDPKTGEFQCRDDGGPTSYRANIVTTDPSDKDHPHKDSFREYMLEFQDLALVYTKDLNNNKVNSQPRSGNLPANNNQRMPLWITAEQTRKSKATPTSPDQTGWAWQGQQSHWSFQQKGIQNTPWNPPKFPNPAGPWPNTVSVTTQGTYTVNYRNEPLETRISDAKGQLPGTANNPVDPGSAAQSYANVYRSIKRLYKKSGVNTKGPQPLSALVGRYDPYTPMLQAYEGDKVQVRLLVGAHLNPHQFTMRGPPWLFEPSMIDSGYRQTQVAGISEHFELNFELPYNPTQGSTADYLYDTDASVGGLRSSGPWGIMRAYGLDDKKANRHLAHLPNNPKGQKIQRLAGKQICGRDLPAGVSAPDPLPHLREYTVLALRVADMLAWDPNSNDYTPAKGLTYQNNAVDNDAVIYVDKDNLQKIGSKWAMKQGMEFEPLVLWAAAGECIKVNLINEFDLNSAWKPSKSQLEARQQRCTPEAIAAAVEEQLGDTAADATSVHTKGVLTRRLQWQCRENVSPASWVGLYPQLVAYDPLDSAGYNIGLNPVQTTSASRGAKSQQTYHWYAGKVAWNDGKPSWTAMEYGAANLLPADPVNQPGHGLFGALIIEPAGATRSPDANTRTAATVTANGEEFREFVLMLQDELPGFPQPKGSTLKIGAGLNLRTAAFSSSGDLTCSLSSQFNISNSIQSAGPAGDPNTPVFPAHAGQRVRFRVVHPGGEAISQVFTLHGHGWQEEPYQIDANGSQVIGPNRQSQWFGSMMGVGAQEHFDFVLEPVDLITGSEPYTIHNGAGGVHRVPGDYLYRTFTAFMFDTGMWGIFRVGPETNKASDIVTITSATLAGGTLTLTGLSTPTLGTSQFNTKIQVFQGDCTTPLTGAAPQLVNQYTFNGSTFVEGPALQWNWSAPFAGTLDKVCVTSDGGGHDTAEVYSSSACP